MSRRVIVCGGRKYLDWAWLSAALDKLHGEDEIVELAHGGATGAEALAGQWAKAHGVTVAVFPDDGQEAGARNARMLAEFRPDVVVAFAGGDGTADMVRRAIKAGIKTVVA